MKLRNLHLLVGLAVVIIFILTGQWMKYHHIDETVDRVRFSIRANHLYILFLGLINLTAGTRQLFDGDKLKSRLLSLSSSLIFTATAVAIYAFFYEDKMGKSRPMILLTAILASIGAIIQALTGLKRQATT